MDLTEIIRDLRQQRAQIDEALTALEGVSSGTRNSNIGASKVSGNGLGKKKRIMSASARKAIAAAQRKRWAKWKREQKAA